MKSRQWGRIIHISSVLGVGGRLKRNVYCACKAALIGLARASALDLGPYGITVNCLCPGPFLTDMPGKLLNDEEKQYFADRTAVKRWAAPRELAGPALMLASEAGAALWFMVGATLRSGSAGPFDCTALESKADGCPQLPKRLSSSSSMRSSDKSAQPFSSVSAWCELLSSKFGSSLPRSGSPSSIRGAALRVL
jgi:hypothetical protein